MAEDLMNFDLPHNKSSIIKVIGVGGGGGNAVNHMFHQGINDVDFMICNTDAQALSCSEIPVKIQLGETLTQGLGAGNKPERGEQAAVESLDKISEVLTHNTKMVFITAGLGGGTGTGAAPIIAEEAKELGILTVGIVTLPFRFEGKRRMNQAIDGLTKMRKHVDSLLVINNEKLREMHGDLTATDAFARADNVLAVAAKGIAEIITVHGSINVDFEDVKAVMSNSGVALMGSAYSVGENRAMDTIQEALTSPLLNNNDIKGAKNILLNIASGPDDEVRIDEIGEITDYVQESAGMNADIIWGNTLDNSLGDKLAITIIATGFGNDSIPELALNDKKKISHHLHDGPETSNKTYQPQQGGWVNTDNKEVPFEVVDKDNDINSKVYNFDDNTKVDDNIERFDLFTDQAQQNSKQPNLDITSASPVDESNIDMVQKKRISYKTENDIEQLENEPAYMRKNIKIDDLKEVDANEEDVSHYSLTDKEGVPKIRKNNSFLNPELD